MTRVADLEVLPEQPLQNGVRPKIGHQRKHVELEDEWESYKVQFTIYDPLYDQDDEMYLEHDSGRQAVKMHRTVNPEPWLISKYGKPLQLWLCTLDRSVIEQANQTRSTTLDQSPEFTYSYVKYKTTDDATLYYERRPLRRLKINDPGESPGAQQVTCLHPSRIQDPKSVVNGQVSKADGSFLTAFFLHRLVENGARHQIYMGSYPSAEGDVDLIVKSGCNAILSLSTEEEMRVRGIDERNAKMLYK